MTDENRSELFKIVRGWLDSKNFNFVFNSIHDAHMGNPDGRMVTMENQHLFRQYRNYISADPLQMIREAEDATP
jgi:hypothetical protein